MVEKIVLGTKQEWEAGTLPPQVDSVINPGFIQMYRPNLSFTRSSTAYLPDGTQIASGLARYWWGKYQNMFPPEVSDFRADSNSDGLADGWIVYTSSTAGEFDAINKRQKIISTGNTSPRIYPMNNLRVESGKTYVLSGYFITNGKSPYVVVKAAPGSTGEAGSIGTKIGATITTEQRVWIIFTPTTEWVMTNFGLSSAITGDWGYVYKVQLEEATLKDAQGNWIPTDWHVGGTGKAIIVEEGTTQIALNSDFEVLNPAKQRVFFDDFNRAGSATFTRATTAIDPISGASVASGVPRYIPGRFQNMVKGNADFEDATGWVFSPPGGRTTPTTYFANVTTEQKWQGNQSAKLEITNGISTDSVRVYRHIQATSIGGTTTAHRWGTFVAGKTYIVSAYINITAVTGTTALSCSCGLDGGGGSTSGVVSKTAVTNGWTRVSWTIVPAAATTSIYVQFTMNSNTAGDSMTAYIDAVQVEESVSGSTTPTDWRLADSGMGALVEEGTTNIAQSPATNLAWWNPPVIKGISGYAYGTDSLYNAAENALQVTSYSSSHNGHGPLLTIERDVAFTIRARMKNVTNAMYTSFIVHLFDASNALVVSNYVPTVVAQSKWTGHNTTYYEDVWLTFKIPSGVHTTATQYTFGFVGSGSVTSEIYLKDIQLERLSYPTSFAGYNTTRNAETLTIPTTGMSPTAGTWGQWVYVNSSIKRQDGTNFPTVFQLLNAAGNDYAIMLYHNRNTAEWKLTTKDDSFVSTTAIIADSLTPDGWRLFTVSWTATAVKLYIDKVLQATINSPKLPTAFSSSTVGYWGLLNYSNTYHDAIRVSNVERTAAEIATYYDATSPLLDDKTVLLLNFDNDLDGEATVQAGWRNMTSVGNWIIKNGKLYSKVPSIDAMNKGWNWHFGHGDAEWKDVDISFKVNMKSSSYGTANAGFAVRINGGTDTNNYLAVSLTSNNNLVVSKRVSAIGSQVASVAYTANLNTEHQIRVVITGTAGSMYAAPVGQILPTTPTLTFTVPSDVPTSGYIAAYSNYAEATFDDIEVKADFPNVWIYNGLTTYPVALTTGYNGTTRALKITNPNLAGTSNSGNRFQNTMTGVTTGVPYTLSFMARGFGNVKAYIFDNAYLTLGSTSFTLSSNWQKFTVTTTANTTTSTIRVAFYPVSGGDWVAVDAVQLEQKNHTTTYRRNDSITSSSIRAAETLSMPTTGLLPSSGSVEFWWTPTQQLNGINDQNTSPRILQIGGYYSNASLVLWAWYNGASGGAGGEPTLRLYIKGQTNTGWSLPGQTIRPSGSGWYVIGKPVRLVVSWINGNTFYVNVNGVEYGPYTITDTITSWAQNTMWFGSLDGLSSCSNGWYSDFRVSSIKRTTAESLAAYNATSSIASDTNIVALYKFNDSLTSEYPPVATIITKAIDLGTIHAAPLDLTAVVNTPIGTSAKLKRYRTSKDGINWNEWREINE